MAKYTPNKDDENYGFIKRMTDLILDVNPAEIASHVEHDSLRDWCNSWQAAAMSELTLAPLRYEPTGCRECAYNEDAKCALAPELGYDQSCGDSRREQCKLNCKRSEDA